jgi:uncharacterized protein (DUF2062 family)
LPLRDRLKLLVTAKGSSRSIALAFAIGIFIGISPFLGLHTILALALASIFRLNRFIALAGAYVTNPWTIIPIYTFSTWLGLKLTGSESSLAHTNFKEITMLNIFSVLKGLMFPFFVGSMFLGVVAGIASYFISYRLLKQIREDRKISEE